MSKKRSQWKVIYKGNIEEFDPSQSIAYWQSRLPSERFSETRSLIDQALAMKGTDISYASRLLRTTAVLKRF